MKRIVAAALLFLVSFGIHAQNAKPPFWPDVQAFKHEDSLHKPPAHPILFIGSSSFTKWKDVSEYFPGYTILNRGFGGSTLSDLIRYADDVIFPYQPKQVVIFCGENDVASSDTITSTTVKNRFITLFQLIRARLPMVPVVFISLKPSPSRLKRHPVMIETNSMIKEYLSKQKKAVFVDIWPDMLDKNGVAVDSLFLSDRLHMTKDGYVIWQKHLAPYLMK